METKLQLIRRVGQEIEATKHETALARTAEELLDLLCANWGYPRYRELGRYQLSFGGSGDGAVTYFLRDKETGVIVHSSGRGDEGARTSCLNAIRVATQPEHVSVCFPKRDSLHAATCNCQDPSRGIKEWTDEDDFERVVEPPRED